MVYRENLKKIFLLYSIYIIDRYIINYYYKETFYHYCRWATWASRTLKKSRSNGYNVQGFTDPISAFQHVKDLLQILLVITNYHMNKLNSYDLNLSILMKNFVIISSKSSTQDMQANGRFYIYQMQWLQNSTNQLCVIIN